MPNTVSIGAGTALVRLHDPSGRRKYLTPGERENFLRAARTAPPDVQTFCETLAFTGCRITEAIRLTCAGVDLAAGIIVFESLKKRRAGVHRAVPVPPEFLKRLGAIHDLRGDGSQRLWNWSRTTAWRRVKDVMDAADIHGPFATPKGLRHSFGIKAIQSEVPLNMTQKWLGHSRIATTAIYADATGREEFMIAARMWADETEPSTTISSRIQEGISAMTRQIRSVLSQAAISTIAAIRRAITGPAKGALAGFMAAAITLAPLVASGQDAKTPSGAPAKAARPTEPDILTKAGDYSVAHPVISIVVLKGQKETQFTGEQIGDKLAEVFKTVYDIPTKVFVTVGGDYTAINFFVKNRLYGPFGLKQSLAAAAAVSRDYEARVRPTVTAKPASGQR
jgi:hypothetical protein